ncbi:MAG: TonB-dependent receptor domain-containing protein, partial [Acidobacteriaceae bacterium]
MKMRRKLVALSMVLGIAFLGTNRLLGQGITTGSITGTIVDPQGAVIPGATIGATNIATGVKLSTTSLGNGAFSFRAVPIGRYNLNVNATGFAPGSIPAVLVLAGVTTDLKTVPLGVTGTGLTVKVAGSTTPLLQVSQSQVTTTFGAAEMATLPLNNGFDTITEVIPGVVSAHDDSFSNSNGDEFVVNGQSSRFNNFELDGQNNNDNTIGGPQVFFGNQDAIAEIQVITNDYSAQYGRDSGAVVNYITKSGTNSFHGSAFEYYQGQFLSSYENQEKSAVEGYCAPGQASSSGCAPVQPLPRFVENRFGATLGGPILKDRLFFFGSGYWDRQFPGASPSTSSSLTPTPAGITQMAAAFPGNNAVAILQSSGPYAIPVGKPTAVPTPAATCGGFTPGPSGTCLETITGPGGATATDVPFSLVQRFVPSPYTDAEYLGRLDWQPTEKDHLFARYYYQSTLAQAADGDVPSGGYVNVYGITHSVGADWTHTFNSNWVDQLRYSFQQATIAFEGGGDPACTISDPTVCAPQVIFNDTSEGFGLNTAFPQGRVVKVTQVQDNATWTHGNQTVLFGGEVDYQNTPTTGLFNYNGTFDFATFSNFIQDAPVAGDPTSAALFLSNGNITVKFRETDIAGYFEDDWKVTPTFTANIGLRWEYFSPFANVYHDETVARESNPATAFWNPALPLADRTFPKMNTFRKGFEPRLGFAWNPEFSPKLVVRGGYAINSDPAFYNIGLLAGSGAPIAIAGTLFCTGGSTCLPGGGKFTGADVRALNLPLFPVGGDPRTLDQSTVATNLVPPYTQTYTLGIDRQLGDSAVIEVRYVGSLTEKNFQSRDANPYLLPVQTDFPSFAPISLCSDPTQVGYGRPNCNYGNISEVDNGGWANYNGLQANLTTRNLHGLTGTLSYTYSKSLDNATDAFASTGAGGSSIAFAQNPLNTDAGERGISGN